MYCEGLTYKLSPIEYGGNGGTNINKMVKLLKGTNIYYSFLFLAMFLETL